MALARSIPAALAAASLTTLAACGGDSDSNSAKSAPATTSTPASTPKPAGTAGAPKGTVPIATYIRRADGICTDGRKQARSQLAPLVRRLQADGKLSEADVMQANAAGARATKPLQRKLTALERPSTKYEEVDAYLQANASTLAALEDAVAAYRRGDKAATRRALALNRVGAGAILQHSRAVGFKSCGSEFSSSSGS